MVRRFEINQAEMKKAFLFPVLFALSMTISGQRSVMELTFTATDSTTWTQVDSIKVMNRTLGGDTVLIYPDTVLVVDFLIGVSDAEVVKGGFQVFRNHPNPTAGQTEISLFVPEKGQVIIAVTDLQGRIMLNAERILDKGTHFFRLTTAYPGIVFFTARWKGNVNTIKVLRTGHGRGMAASLEYLRASIDTPVLKIAEKSRGGFSFSPGDELLYIGYLDTLQSGMIDIPGESQIYTFQFASNIPCPGSPTVEYLGQVYNTVQIFSQCWLKENLDVGTMINGLDDMQDNGIMEKYCYNNDITNCEIYGGLYQWDEMMQYVPAEGSQGICPPGWHIPSDEEWKVLEGAVDSQYGIGDPVWDLATTRRGYDAGSNLKSTSTWNSGGNGLDPLGFNLLAGGARGIMGFANTLGYYSSLWTASASPDDPDYSIYRNFGFSWQDIYRGTFSKVMGFSVRCLKDQLP